MLQTHFDPSLTKLPALSQVVQLVDELQVTQPTRGVLQGTQLLDTKAYDVLVQAMHTEAEVQVRQLERTVLQSGHAPPLRA